MLQAPQEFEHTRSEPHPKLYEYIHATPTDRSAILLPHGQSLDLKLETEQETESFKSRGAVNWLLNHPEHHTVITASAGSFGPGLAYGTDVLGRRAIVFMPKTTPEPKIQAVKDYGGEVHLSGESFSDTEPAMLAFAKKNNFPVAHPFNDPDVIAGYRTVFDEILADSDEPT
ncbi:MAG TPA: pyridoxal-phosphate dependent enzyme, partial [Candidatus Saccharimonadaceae bacterium]|nr:pyridoxal-phosphate dependent enzyme [Candidatus Saccharimonadaceae bacterium]